VLKHDLDFAPVSSETLLRCVVCEEPKAEAEACQHCGDVVCRACLADVLVEHTQCAGGRDAH
jgi:formylmethanofuran dehydrogenase subunit E